MAALRSRCGHYIFALWFLLSFFLAYPQPLQIGCLPYMVSIHTHIYMSIYTWCRLSANLGCRSSETRCTRLAEIQDAKNAKNSPSAHHRTTLSGYIFAIATTAHIENREKLVKQQYLPHMSNYNMVNFGPLAAEIGSLVWGTPANFNGFRVLAALLHVQLTLFMANKFDLIRFD